MNLKLILILTLAFLRVETTDPDENIPTVDLIRSKGYLAEEHDVTTQDGYVVTIQRIIPPKHINNRAPKPAVLLQHGLLDASSTWVVNFPAQSLGFILADKGFDVWLGNVRGNTYALHNIKYNKNQEEFWNFSFDEMATYDIPAMVDYILNETSQPQLFYVGHSQGTMVAFAKLSSDPKFNAKIKLFLALGPVAKIATMVSPIKYLAQIGASTQQEIWYRLFGKKDFLPSTEFIRFFAGQLCNLVVADKLICENLLIALCGPSKNLNETRIPVYVTHAPAGTSTKNLVHFAQLVVNKNFQMYDYGADDNQKYYNQSTAPIYDVKNVKAPVALYWGKQDWLADPTDVEYLRQNLPNIIDDYGIDNWSHLDFVWASNATQAFYDRMIQQMLRIN